MVEDEHLSHHQNMQNIESREEGGDVESRNIIAQRMEISGDELAKRGHGSVDDLLRNELVDAQGASAGYNTGVDATSTLNVGVTEGGRDAFRESRKKAIDAYFGNLIHTLSVVEHNRST
jgi:hypothetical protein